MTSHRVRFALEASGRLSFVQRFLSVTKQRRQKIAQDRPRSCLDFHRCRHAGRQIDDTVIDPHLRMVERNARGVVELLALGLAAVTLGLTGCGKDPSFGFGTE